jgi:hypothetical protein
MHADHAVPAQQLRHLRIERGNRSLGTRRCLASAAGWR